MKAMALRITIFFLFAAIFLFFFLSANSATRPPAMAKSASEDDTSVVEVIKNVKKNKKVQELGRFALKQINKKAFISSGGKDLYSGPLAFCGVAKAKRWRGLDGWNYYFFIKSEKVVQKIKGSLNVYVYTSSDGNVITVKAGIFMPEKKKVHF